jgi:integrase/recombinase XerD
MIARERAEEYLALRRTLGYQLKTEGRIVLAFAEWLDQTAQSRITATAALAWACEPETSPNQHSRRLAAVRGFARHMAAFDPGCEIPSSDLLPARTHRSAPYLYSPEEIAALIHAAGTIAAPLHAATMHTVICLITASGMRLGETLGLDRRDVDLDEAMLTVTGKNGHTRLVPLHLSTAAMLDDYAQRRDRLCPGHPSAAFFITRTGRRVQQSAVQHTFATLLTLAEIQTPPGRRHPRVHDLRHLFAVTVLTGWHRDGLDVAARLPVLSTFLGHATTESTYWYLEASLPLLTLAAQRLERQDSGGADVTAQGEMVRS